jgi:hypothetical protein
MQAAEVPRIPLFRQSNLNLILTSRAPNPACLSACLPAVLCVVQCGVEMVEAAGVLCADEGGEATPCCGQRI